MELKSFFKNLLRKDVSVEGAIKRHLIVRAPRIRMTPGHQIRFRLSAPFDREIQIANISVRGLGLLASEASGPAAVQWPDPGTLVSGVLIVGGSSHAISLKLIHISGTIGCQFEHPPRRMLQEIYEYLHPELSAVEMIYVGPSKLQEDPAGVPHWYHGKDHCELHLVVNAAEVVRFHLVYRTHYLEGGSNVPFRYGQVVNEEQYEKPSYKGSELVRWESTVSGEALSLAKRLLQNIPNLPHEHRDAIVAKMGEMGCN